MGKIVSTVEAPIYRPGDLIQLSKVFATYFMREYREDGYPTKSPSPVPDETVVYIIIDCGVRDYGHYKQTYMDLLFDSRLFVITVNPSQLVEGEVVRLNAKEGSHVLLQMR